MASTSGASLKPLHVPGNPIILANVWDIPSLNAVASLNSGSNRPVRVLATASWGIAGTHGLADADLSADQNIKAIQELGPFAKKAGIPLSVDIQDGYGDRLDEVVRLSVQAGAAGANVEDSIPSAGFGKGVEGSLYPLDVQVERFKRVLAVAKENGEPDFVLNARCDALVLDPAPKDVVDEAIRRGKAYLAAGATTVFYWGGALNPDVLKTLVKELDGKVSVMMGSGTGSLTKQELAQLGVARISVGPRLYFASLGAIKEGAAKLLE